MAAVGGLLPVEMVVVSLVSAVVVSQVVQMLEVMLPMVSGALQAVPML